MSESEDRRDDPAITAARKVGLTEDWAAVLAGLALIALVLVGAVPAGLVP